MTRDQAWAQLLEFYRQQPHETRGRSLPEWLGEEPELVQMPNGNWLAIPRALLHHGVLLKTDGVSHHYLGALGQLVPKLGFPCSGELHLGSCRQGRYQMFERGVGVWEALKGVGDLGYPIATWPSVSERARSSEALVAFFDLRGFTSWSAQNTPQRVQEVIERLESAFQEAFVEPWTTQLFCKGTGDGFMVVSEGEWYDPNASELRADHVRAFCRACATAVRRARPEIPNELAIGCGITLGKLTQLYLLGRYDYIGPAVNFASKIQAIAYNELCLSTEVVEQLERDGLTLAGMDIPGKGRRVPPDEILRDSVRKGGA